MVAPHHPSFRPAGARPLGRRLDAGRRPWRDREVGGRMGAELPSPPSSGSGCRERRPQLKLVVDNTVRRAPERSRVAAGRQIDSASEVGGSAGVKQSIHGGGSAGVVQSFNGGGSAGVKQSIHGGGSAGVKQSFNGGGAAMSSSPAAVVAGELGAWLGAVARLVEARWRLARQRWINRNGRFGLMGPIASHGPLLAVAGIALFGGLAALRVAQESGSADHVPSVGGIATVAAGSAGESVAAASAAASVDRLAPSVVVVHPGDSLWSIATSRFPEHDPRRVVDAFVEANGGSAIHSGQQLVIPAALLEG